MPATMPDQQQGAILWTLKTPAGTGKMSFVQLRAPLSVLEAMQAAGWLTSDGYYWLMTEAGMAALDRWLAGNP